MQASQVAVRTTRGTLWALIALAGARVVLHALTNGQYGFHRDELATLDDARYLAWGYVAYPPLTPFMGRLGLDLFGASLTGIRLFPALAQGVALVLAGLMARDLGAGRAGQLIAGMAVAVAPVSIASGSLLQYVAFDYLWWVAVAWGMARMLRTGDERWWLAVGAFIGLGMMTKYTMIFLVAGIAVGVLSGGMRSHLKSRWLWLGAALSLLIALPNLVWQAQHQFISVDFLNSIHARDIRIGRTDGFLLKQLLVGAHPFTLPLWIAGLYFYFVSPTGKRFRTLGWMFVIPLALFTVAKGRDYYMAPAYPILLAAGSVVWERWVKKLKPGWAGAVRHGTWAVFLAGGVPVAALVLPMAPVNSGWWKAAVGVNGDLVEEIGWPELTGTVAKIHDSLPEAERARAGILTGNYGEAGALNLYGPAYGLPRAISGVNSYWLRGYGEPAPETVIALGISRDLLNRNFAACELAGQVSNRYGVRNEETSHPDIFVCRQLRKPWPEFWKTFRRYG